ncbi:MAG: YbaN family protein [Pseudomonadales bacterium]|nr:YbaN family protein [Pseudomonadales bacterium]
MLEYKQHDNVIARYFLICVGWVSVVLGVVGIFLPLLPTTPFMLLAAICFSKSSKRFHEWLLNQPHLGNYIRMYLEGKGITAKTKVVTLIFLWLTIGSSATFFVEPVYLKVMMVAIALAVTIHLLRMPTLKPEALPDTAKSQV